MGSNPITATITSPSADEDSERTSPHQRGDPVSLRNPHNAAELPSCLQSRLLDTLEHFFTETVPVGSGETIVVAFSGGPDSSALLWGLSELRGDHGWYLVAAHLDHGIDDDSARRASRAGQIARELGVPCVAERVSTGAGSRGVEATARRLRYDFLERVRRARDARCIATAHHRDDQVETVLLRLRYGSGLRGLRGIRECRGRVVRPLLGLAPESLAGAVSLSGISPVRDPTNLDPSFARNRLRHRILPRLEEELDDAAERILSLRDSSIAAASRLDPLLEKRFPPRHVDGWSALDLDRLTKTPEPLRVLALDLLHRRAGHPYPPRRSAVDELLGQLRRLERSGGETSVRCDCAAGWRWEVRRGALLLLSLSEPISPFAYTLPVPGSVLIPEAGIDVSVRREPVAAWMRTGDPRRSAVDLPLCDGNELVVRSRRPGDRLQPLGMSGTRRLKDVLIDRKIPREGRDRLPLVCIDGEIACVPGVVVDDRFRLRASAERAWVVEIGGPTP